MYSVGRAGGRAAGNPCNGHVAEAEGFLVQPVDLGHNTVMHPQSIVFAGLTTPGNVLWQAGAAARIPAKKHEKVAWEKDPESVLSSHTRGAETRAHVVHLPPVSTRGKVLNVIVLSVFISAAAFGAGFLSTTDGGGKTRYLRRDSTRVFQNPTRGTPIIGDHRRSSEMRSKLRNHRATEGWRVIV